MSTMPCWPTSAMWIATGSTWSVAWAAATTAIPANVQHDPAQVAGLSPAPAGTVDRAPAHRRLARGLAFLPLAIGRTGSSGYTLPRFSGATILARSACSVSARCAARRWNCQGCWPGGAQDLDVVQAVGSPRSTGCARSASATGPAPPATTRAAARSAAPVGQGGGRTDSATATAAIRDAWQAPFFHGAPWLRARPTSARISWKRPAHISPGHYRATTFARPLRFGEKRATRGKCARRPARHGGGVMLGLLRRRSADLGTAEETGHRFYPGPAVDRAGGRAAVLSLMRWGSASRACRR